MRDDLEKLARELRDAMCGSGDLCRNDAGCGCLDRLLAFARTIAAKRDDEMGKLQAQCVAALWLIPGDSTLGQLQDAHDKAKALIAERDKLKAEVERLSEANRGLAEMRSGTWECVECEHCAPLRADLDRAREAHAKLAAVLDGAGQQFRHYEQLHLAKPDVAKAAANALMAIKCENALRDARLALQKAAALHEPTGEKAT